MHQEFLETFGRSCAGSGDPRTARGSKLPSRWPYDSSCNYTTQAVSLG